MSNIINDQWLAANTTGVTVAPGSRVTLAVVSTYEISDQVDPTTGARLLHPVGRSGRAGKNARAVKTRNVQQVVQVAALASAE